VIDVRAIVQRNHRNSPPKLIPPFLVPQKGRYGLRDYEKLFCAEFKSGEDDIFDQRGIDRADGCIVVVRPDQFVANVLPLDGVLRARRVFRPVHDRLPRFRRKSGFRPDARSAAIRVVEIWNWVWVWTGDPALADATLHSGSRGSPEGDASRLASGDRLAQRPEGALSADGRELARPLASQLRARPVDRDRSGCRHAG
jgi:hypothetical protein